ncbi:MAG: PilZ domain-containing protein [Candidatus Krumholzibacteriota bacterium]|nr:PilZ domain-containing protein [Candidatus Krumholzibacteriota bacterium]
MSFKERRRTPRVNVNLPIIVSGEKGDENGRTLNISTNGVYFESPRFIDPLTKVQMELVIPLAGDKDRKNDTVSFDGIVVRVEPEKEDADTALYRIAVFFTFLNESSLEILSNFIKDRL